MTCHCGKEFKPIHGLQKHCSSKCRKALVSRIRSKRHFLNYSPPKDWNERLEVNKQTSVYYGLLVKQYGIEFAEACWKHRMTLENEKDSGDTFYEIYQAVKNYKPRDPLCLVGSYNQGWSKI